MSFFGDIERFLADLYPYRWPISLSVLVAVAAAAAVLYRRAVHLALWRHRVLALVLAVPMVVAAVPLGDYLVSPLWERTHLEEASPIVTGAGTATSGPAETGKQQEAGITDARVVGRGAFRGADDFHFGRGTAQLVATTEGRHVLRLEQFSVRNGPDLFVYLSPRTDGYGEGALNLGALKATDGSFNYDIPGGTDVARFKSAIIWCRQFSVLFAVAPLSSD